MSKSATEKTLSTTKKTVKNAVDNEPLVHYNGPYHTLESLPVEKLNWIKDEQTSTLVKNPLTNYTKSIVLRKPLTRSQTYPAALNASSYSRPLQPKPKGMFYLRGMCAYVCVCVDANIQHALVLQVIATDTSKSKLPPSPLETCSNVILIPFTARLFRCGVQINQETCLSSYVTSEKTGKHSSIAQFDETFLLQVYIYRANMLETR